MTANPALGARVEHPLGVVHVGVVRRAHVAGGRERLVAGPVARRVLIENRCSTRLTMRVLNPLRLPVLEVDDGFVEGEVGDQRPGGIALDEERRCRRRRAVRRRSAETRSGKRTAGGGSGNASPPRCACPSRWRWRDGRCGPMVASVRSCRLSRLRADRRRHRKGARCGGKRRCRRDRPPGRGLSARHPHHDRRAARRRRPTGTSRRRPSSTSSTGRAMAPGSRPLDQLDVLRPDAERDRAVIEAGRRLHGASSTRSGPEPAVPVRGRQAARDSRFIGGLPTKVATKVLAGRL